MTIFGKILLGLILVVAAVLIIKGANDDAEITEENGEEVAAENKTSSESELSTFQGSARDLMARGGDYKCTFTQEVENSTSTGTVYISGAKMRGDFNSTASTNGATMDAESHMISDGTSIWVWSSAMPSGLKMKADAEMTAETGEQSFDANQDLEYLCVAWTPEESQFSLPTGITFTDFTQVQI